MRETIGTGFPGGTYRAAYFGIFDVVRLDTVWLDKT